MIGCKKNVKKTDLCNNYNYVIIRTSRLNAENRMIEFKFFQKIYLYDFTLDTMVLTANRRENIGIFYK